MTNQTPRDVPLGSVEGFVRDAEPQDAAAPTCECDHSQSSHEAQTGACQTRWCNCPVYRAAPRRAGEPTEGILTELRAGIAEALDYLDTNPSEEGREKATHCLLKCVDRIEAVAMGFDPDKLERAEAQAVAGHSKILARLTERDAATPQLERGTLTPENDGPIEQYRGILKGYAFQPEEGSTTIAAAATPRTPAPTTEGTPE